MSPELQAFLAAEDLDDVLIARDKIAMVGAEDDAAIRAILAEWENPQAISNLLFHPNLIPEDIRLATLHRGLAERKAVLAVGSGGAWFWKLIAVAIVHRAEAVTPATRPRD